MSTTSAVPTNSVVPANSVAIVVPQEREQGTQNPKFTIFHSIIQKGTMFGEFLWNFVWEKKHKISIGLIGQSLQEIFWQIIARIYPQQKKSALEMTTPQYLTALDAVATKILCEESPLWKEEGFFRTSGSEKNVAAVKEKLCKEVRAGSQVEFADPQAQAPDYATVFKRIFTELYKRIAKEKGISLESSKSFSDMTQLEQIGLNDEVSKEIHTVIERNEQLYKKTTQLFQSVAGEEGSKITKLVPETLVVAFPQIVGILVHIFPEKAVPICDAIGSKICVAPS